MLVNPMDVLYKFPVRKTKAQKQAFRDAVQEYVKTLGYPVSVEAGSFGSRNLVIGDPEQARYLVTAHYDTCARLLLPNLLTPFSPMLFALYQCLHACLLILPSFVAGFMAMLGVMFYVAFSGLDVAAIAHYGFLTFLGIYTPLVVLSLLWIYFGPANQNNANDNTSGVVTLLEIARTMPENQRHKVCFVLFDQEEKGLWGSRSYRRIHKDSTDRQLILNLDCVGDGDHIRLIPTKTLRKDRKKLTAMYKACGYMGNKSILLQEKGWMHCASDHKHFPWGVGIVALKKRRKLLYLSRIHTRKDTVLDINNVNILRAALTTFICCDEVN